MSAKRKRKYKIVGIKSSKTLWLLIVVLLFGICSLLALRSSLFDIKSIEVLGNIKLSRETVIAQSGIKEGESVFSFHSKAVAERLSALPEVKSAQLKRVLPDSVQISITERIASMIVKTANSYLGIEDDGTVLEVSDDMTGMAGILITGACEESFPIGTTVDFSENARLSVARSVAAYLNKMELAEQVSEIYAAPSGYFYIYTSKASVIKFYSYTAFEANEEFVARFILNETRKIMAEVIEDVEPVYRVIEIV